MSGIADKSHELRAFAPALILLLFALSSTTSTAAISRLLHLCRKTSCTFLRHNWAFCSPHFLDLHRDGVCQRLDGGQL
jgi:hypothetical protein